MFYAPRVGASPSELHDEGTNLHALPTTTIKHMKIFLSCVSAQFQACRDDLAPVAARSWLRRELPADHLRALAKAGRYAYPFDTVGNILTGVYKHFGIPEPDAMTTFISFSTADQTVADAFVDELRLFYIDDFFFSPRSLDEGYWLSQIEEEIAKSQWFFMLISPRAIGSTRVRKEVELAMTTPHLKGKVIPVLLEPTPGWEQLHPHIKRLQAFHLSIAQPQTSYESGACRLISARSR